MAAAAQSTDIDKYRKSAFQVFQMNICFFPGGHLYFGKTAKQTRKFQASWAFAFREHPQISNGAYEVKFI